MGGGLHWWRSATDHSGHSPSSPLLQDHTDEQYDEENPRASSPTAPLLSRSLQTIQEVYLYPVSEYLDTHDSHSWLDRANHWLAWIQRIMLTLHTINSLSFPPGKTRFTTHPLSKSQLNHQIDSLIVQPLSQPVITAATQGSLLSCTNGDYLSTHFITVRNALSRAFDRLQFLNQWSPLKWYFDITYTTVTRYSWVAIGALTFIRVIIRILISYRKFHPTTHHGQLKYANQSAWRKIFTDSFGCWDFAGLDTLIFIWLLILASGLKATGFMNLPSADQIRINAFGDHYEKLKAFVLNFDSQQEGADVCTSSVILLSKTASEAIENATAVFGENSTMPVPYIAGLTISGLIIIMRAILYWIRSKSQTRSNGHLVHDPEAPASAAAYGYELDASDNV